MSDKALPVIPSNSALLETGLDLAFAKLLDRIAPPFPQLMNPLQTPVDFLSYLAADRGVDEWRAGAPESEKRATVAASWGTKRQAGTKRALEQAVSGLEMRPEVVAWHERLPLGTPYSFSVMAWVDRAYDDDIDARLMKRIQAAKSERDEVTVSIGVQLSGGIYTGLVTFGGDVVSIQPYQITELAASPMKPSTGMAGHDWGTTTIYPRPL